MMFWENYINRIFRYRNQLVFKTLGNSRWNCIAPAMQLSLNTFRKFAKESSWQHYSLACVAHLVSWSRGKITCVSKCITVERRIVDNGTLYYVIFNQIGCNMFKPINALKRYKRLLGKFRWVLCFYMNATSNNRICTRLHSWVHIIWLAFNRINRKYG